MKPIITAAASHTEPHQDAHDQDAHDQEAHDLGLPHDLAMMLSRRRALRFLAGVGTTGLIASCGPNPMGFGSQPDKIATDASGAECVLHPQETAGPYPADGSNNAHGTLANVLRQSGILRQDMRTSFGDLSGQAEGVDLDVTLTLVDVDNACAPLQGHVIYLWHCTNAGAYSLYDLPQQNFLRAVGVADSKGEVRFRTIYPGCYAGRYPHMHFEVYPSLDSATDYRSRILTSQIAMPDATNHAIYEGVPAYSASIANYARSPLSRDNIFADNTQRQLAAQTMSITGTAQTGLRGSVMIGVSRG
ncbi:MAG: hypothetical protein MRY63_00205 [Neomegalonema sp.]|nr:hypothetical protein [Neomegalonema sp.]